MHDGRLATLADVIEHYRIGIQPHPDFDPALRGRFAFRCILESSVQALPNPSEALRKLRPTLKGYRFSSQGTAAPARFLHALTDEKLAGPFIEARWPVIMGFASGGGGRLWTEAVAGDTYRSPSSRRRPARALRKAESRFAMRCSTPRWVGT